MKNEFIPFGSRGYFKESKLGASPKAVYVIDDKADGLVFISRALEEAGYGCHLCDSLESFARNFQEAGAVAIFVDIRLRDEDATDVLTYLRRLRSQADVYLISGDPAALDSTRRFAEEIGVGIADTITKPFTGKTLIDRLKSRTGDVEEMFEQIDVAEAIENAWIYPVLQPKLDVASGRIKSAELLSRMAHPAFGFVSPRSFIDKMTVAQRQTLFLRNLSFVRRNFGASQRGWDDFSISVNTDAAKLPNVRSHLREISENRPELFRNLMFEITEEAVVRLSEEQLQAFYKLNLDGARFSIDDFGTGHSNFARLSRLPIAEIKIDRSIVHGCASVRSRELIVRSIASMAHDLGARVVAEGVESTDDFECVTQAGCDEIQGFLIGRPMKLDRFRPFVSQFNESKR